MRTISRNVLGPSFAVPKSPPLKGSQAPSAVFFSFQFLFSPLFKDSSLWTRLESDPCNHHSATQILIAYHLQGSAPWGGHGTTGKLVKDLMLSLEKNLYVTNTCL